MACAELCLLATNAFLGIEIAGRQHRTKSSARRRSTERRWRQTFQSGYYVITESIKRAESEVRGMLCNLRCTHRTCSYMDGRRNLRKYASAWPFMYVIYNIISNTADLRWPPVLQRNQRVGGPCGIQSKSLCNNISIVLFWYTWSCRSTAKWVSGDSFKGNVWK